MGGERLTTVVRQWTCIVLGAGGIAYQQITLRVSWELLVVHVLLLAPTLAESLVRLRTAMLSASSTTPSPPPSAPGSSSLPSPPTSPRAGGAEAA